MLSFLFRYYFNFRFVNCTQNTFNVTMNTDIYTIYRSCRLCGVGAGYKMPIIQSVIEIDNDEIELKQKIKECVQIEVNFHDRMPPLICELCVDKIQDFYEFRKMCQETNKKTRLRLGLPMQTLRSTLQSEPDCILGVTEPLNSDSDETAPLSKQAKKSRPKSAKIKKESDVKIKDEPIVVEEQDTPSAELERRETRRKRPPSPKRVTRQNRAEDSPLELQDVSIAKPSPRLRPGPKSAVRHDRERQKVPEKETTDDKIEENIPPPRLKRSRETLESTVSVKKSKLSLEPAKQRPGPKFSKEAFKPNLQKPPPKACPKSKTQESLPPKSNKSESISTPGPKSKKTIPEFQELTTRSKKPEAVPVVKLKFDVSKSKAKSLTLAGPKSKKSEFATPTPKNKTRDASSLAPLCKKREPSPKADRASPPPPKVSSLECNICGIKAKAAQGLRSHMNTHVPNIINAKMACNACELWFPDVEAATVHHEQHAAGIGYTCAKCYDDFRTSADYELHFVQNQCLPTYEVPDVKCDMCWKLFPTYKLLEDHKCPGEGGRPGGKCLKCNRTYVSLKGLITHEMRCSVKKKEEPDVELEKARGMLAMRVRLVRCDSLLTPRDGRYSVGRLSHKFGLDCNCIYPYLSMGGVKLEPATTFDHMVTIDDEIKEEYLNRVDTNEEDMVHWDSESDSDSDISSPNKSVDTLSIIALKTLYSPKCLGKVPRKKRKVKLESGLGSILGIHFHDDFRSDIDNIIESLANESNATDNKDSDSILDKDVERRDENSELLDNLKNLASNENAVDERIIENSENNTCSADIGSDRRCNNSNDSEEANLNQTETINHNEVCNQSTVNDKPDIQVDRDLNVINDSQSRLNEDTKSELPQKCNNETEATKSNDMSTSDDVSLNNDTYKNSQKNGQLLSNNIEKDEPLSVVDKENSNTLKNMDSKQSESKSNNKNVNNFVNSSDVKISETIEKQPTSNIEKEIDTEVGSSSLESNKTSEHEIIQKVEPQSSHETDDKICENDVSTSAINGKTDDKDETFKTANNNRNDEDVVNNESEETAKSELVDSKDSLITENELFDNDNIPIVDKFNINFLDEEDKLLMAELDEQIGENQLDSATVGVKIPQSDVTGEKKDVFDENSDVIGENSLAISENCDLINKYSCVGVTECVSEQNTTLDAAKNNQNNLNLDSISDEEFNFDI